MTQLWEVVGGSGTGGVLVRSGASTASEQLPARLTTGSLVREVEIQGDRLHYNLQKGSGPEHGWISVRLKGKELAIRSSETSNETPSPPSPPPEFPGMRALFGFLGQDAPLQDMTVPDGKALRIINISDIHVDYKVNLSWFEAHIPKKSEDVFSVLILPGDVSDDLDIMRKTFKMFLVGFDLVCFTPGNHDIWIRKKDSPADSMRKFCDILQVCMECGVQIRPVRFRSNNGSVPDVYLVPLLSFYSSDWDREPEMPWFPKDPALTQWMDFRTIKWPRSLIKEVEKREGKFSFDLEGGTSDTISQIFAAMNESFLKVILAARNESSSDVSEPIVISYAHYVPRQELFPPKRFLLNPYLHKVSGSIALEQQIRRLCPNLHIFGHTHLTVDCVIDNIRYVQWALGNPTEQKAMTQAVADTGMLVVFDSRETPMMPPVQETFWGRFFAKYPRDVNETCPASFIRQTFKTRYPDIELPFDDEYFFNKTITPGAPIRSYEGLFEPRWRQ